MQVQKNRGSQTPISDVMDIVKDTLPSITPLRLLQWIEAAYWSLGQVEDYKRIAARYGTKEMLEGLDEEVHNILALL